MMCYTIGDVVEADYISHKHLYFILDIISTNNKVYVLRPLPGDLVRDLYCQLINTETITYRKVQMSLTKEMIIGIDEEIVNFNDEELITYNRSYYILNSKYPNSFFKYRVDRSNSELINRGLDPTDATQIGGNC